jgi:hypothetical protein
VNTWWKKARDRYLWSEVIREATANGGCGVKEEEEDDDEEEEVQVKSKIL